MKKWNVPVIEEIDLSETEYGGPTSHEFDDQWLNRETGEWEGTFVS